MLSLFLLFADDYYNNDYAGKKKHTADRKHDNTERAYAAG